MASYGSFVPVTSTNGAVITFTIDPDPRILSSSTSLEYSYWTGGGIPSLNWAPLLNSTVINPNIQVISMSPPTWQLTLSGLQSGSTYDFNSSIVLANSAKFPLPSKEFQTAAAPYTLANITNQGYTAATEGYKIDWSYSSVGSLPPEVLVTYAQSTLGTLTQGTTSFLVPYSALSPTDSNVVSVAGASGNDRTNTLTYSLPARPQVVEGLTSSVIGNTVRLSWMLSSGTPTSIPVNYGSTSISLPSGTTTYTTPSLPLGSYTIVVGGSQVLATIGSTSGGSGMSSLNAFKSVTYTNVSPGVFDFSVTAGPSAISYVSVQTDDTDIPKQVIPIGPSQTVTFTLRLPKHELIYAYVSPIYPNGIKGEEFTPTPSLGYPPDIVDTLISGPYVSWKLGGTGPVDRILMTVEGGMTITLPINVTSTDVSPYLLLGTTSTVFSLQAAYLKSYGQPTYFNVVGGTGNSGGYGPTGSTGTTGFGPVPSPSTREASFWSRNALWIIVASVVLVTIIALVLYFVLRHRNT